MPEIKSKADIKPRIVPITFGDYSAYCRVVSGTERDEWVKFIRAQANNDVTLDEACMYYCRNLVKCLCDSNGAALFGCAEEVNSSLDVASIEDAYKEASKVNRLTREGIEEEKKA